MLRNVVGQRTGYRVLKKPFIGDEALAIDILHLNRIKIHRHYADEREHAQDDVENRDSGWKII